MSFPFRILRTFLVAGTLLGILATLLVPLVCPSHCGGRALYCANNLRQLYQLQAVYASTHRGAWLDARGSALWQALAHIDPPLIEKDDRELMCCPIRGESADGQVDYLGPRNALSTLKSSDPLGADKPGNHGEGLQGNVLLKDGSVQELEDLRRVWESLSD